MKIIEATPKHFKEIIDIYNWAILNTTATFDTELKTLENYSNFLKSFTKLPLIVMEDGNRVTGWAYLKPYSDRCAYDDTVELSIYIHPQFHGQGIGKKLMSQILMRAEQLNLHTILSRVTAESEASIRLHEKFDFFTVGVMKEVGLKFNRRIDVIFMQKLL